MRYAVISDVHSNLDALEAVFSDMDRRQIRDIIFVGDAVGYGPEPNEVVLRCFRQSAALFSQATMTGERPAGPIPTASMIMPNVQLNGRLR